MNYPATAAGYHRRHKRLLLALLLAVRQSWRRLDQAGSWEEQYQTDVGPRILALVLAAQTAATRDADAYVAELLNELAFGPSTRPGVVPVNAFVGLTGDGRSVETLLATTVGRARASVARQRSRVLEETEAPGSLLTLPELTVTLPETREMRQQGLADGEAFLQTVVATLIADSTRAAESVAMVEREWVDGYYRMLQPPSCSRCAVLAGRFYKWNAGFERHPNCDCVHIPARESDFADLRLSGDKYFHSLPTAAVLDERYPHLTVKARREAGLVSQEDIFTVTGAQAIRDGADVNQVVNARRGMRQAQVYGHDVVLTTEGTTRRGVAFDALERGGTTRVAEELATRLTRNGPELRRIHRERARSPRLMPESIYAIAGDDRAEAVRLLHAHGYLV